MDQQEFDRLLDTIARAKLNKTLKDSVTAALAAHGFTRWLYASENPYGMLKLPATLANEFGEWMLRYMIKGFQRIDPIVIHCRTSKEPLLWDPKVGWEEASDDVRAFMEEVAAHGFGSAVAIPLCGPNEKPQGVLSITCAVPLSESRARYEKALPRLVQIGQTMHVAMTNILKTNERLQEKYYQNQ